MDLTSNKGLQDPFYPKSAIIVAIEEIEERLCCIEDELKPLAALCGPGGVVFTNAANEVINDCNEFFWDNAIKELGIGTNTPSSKLHVYSLTDSVIATFESIAGNAIISLLSHDNYGSYINYQENTSGDQWQVGENGTTGEFEWIDGNDFGLNLRAGFTRSGQLGAGSATSLRLYDGQVGGQSYFSLRANNVMASDNDYVWPAGYPAGAGDILSSDLAGQLSWIPAGGGSPWTLTAPATYNLFTSNSFPPGGSQNIIAGANNGSATLVGTHNIAIGAADLTGLTSGITNIALGLSNFSALATGNRNIAVGSTISPILLNGSNNILLGTQPGASLTSGSRNILLGESTGLSFPNTGNDNLLMGYLAGQGAGAPAFGVNPGSHTNILLGPLSLSGINDYKPPPTHVPVAGHTNGWEEVIAIGRKAGNWSNTYNANQSIFIGNESGPIGSDVYAERGTFNPWSKQIFSVTSGLRNQTGGLIGQEGGQIVLYGSEKTAASGNTYGRQLMVSGGNVGDYTGAPPIAGAPPCQTPNATLHVVGNGSTDATYVASQLWNIHAAGNSYFGDAALLVENGAGFADGSVSGIGTSQILLEVDHDGVVKMPALPQHVGPGVPPGLPAGSLWVDTAGGNNIVKFI
ncbi:MAG: hypothetical protein ABGY11_09075 [Candidatus Thioglobus sp.]